MREPGSDISDWRGVWVFAEQWEARLESVAFELLGEGRRLADKLDVELSAVLVGHRVRPLADDLAFHGADRVYVADDPLLGLYHCVAYASVLRELVSRERPEVLLFGSTAIGRDLAPRLAAIARTGLSADCVALEIDEERKLLQVVPAFGGKVMATIVSPRNRPQIATIRPGVMRARAPEERSSTIIDVAVNPPEGIERLKVLELAEEEGREDASLEGAETIVGGGEGVSDQEGWDLVAELAEVLHGAVGGTRPALDNGWIPEPAMIGQSGTTVAPNLYVAVGVSGEMQHAVGVQGARVIAAINSDAEAAIFSGADFGIVGDYRDVLPPLIEEIKKII